METVYCFLRAHPVYFITLLSAFLAAAVLRGLSLYRKSTGLEFVERRLLALIPASGLVLIFLVFHKIAASVAAPYNWTRLQRTFLLAHGEKTYYPPDGPVVLAMYGPLSALVYWPAVWMRSLSSAMHLASLISLVLYLLPAWVMCAVWRAREPRRRFYGTAAFFIFVYFAFTVSSLRSAAFNVHADAPALGFSGLACAALCWEKNKPRLWALALAAWFTAAAFWSKQVTAPLFLAVSSALWIRGQRRELFIYLGFFAAGMTAVSGIFFQIFGFENLWFNLVTIPSRQPWVGAGGFQAILSAAAKLLHESFFVFLFAVFIFFSSGKPDKAKAPFLFLWTALFMLPAAILGKLKAGGANNVFCYVPYFLLLAALSALSESNQRGRLKRFTNGVLLGLLGVHSVFLIYKFTVPPLEGNYAQIAYAYLKKHPGEAYFPRLTLVHLLAEHKVYHESVALIDRAWAKLPVEPSQLRRFIPADAKLMAFHEASGDDRHWLALPEYTVKTVEPELPGFVVYKRECTSGRTS